MEWQSNGLRSSFCPNNFVNATPLKTLDWFWWNFTGLLHIICRCAYYTAILIRHTLQDLWDFNIFHYSGLWGNLVNVTPLKPLDQFWCNFAGLLHMICSCTDSTFLGVVGLIVMFWQCALAGDIQLRVSILFIIKWALMS